MSLYKPKFLSEWNIIRQEGGYKLLIKKKGWVVLVAFFIFYLILIPYLAFSKIITCI